MRDPDLNPKEFKLMRPLTWADVFEIWRRNEAQNPNWVKHYKGEGFSSWEEWRTKKVAVPLRCAEKDWHLYRIIDPLKTVPAFHGGPFKSWEEKYYRGETLPTFARLVENPEVQSHGYVKQLLADFPKETTVTGLVTEGGIVIIEGMHRCCAIALAAQRRQILETTVSIALAEVSSGDFPGTSRSH